MKCLAVADNVPQKSSRHHHPLKNLGHELNKCHDYFHCVEIEIILPPLGPNKAVHRMCHITVGNMLRIFWAAKFSIVCT